MGKRGSSLAVQLLCMGIWLWCGVMAAPGDEKKGGYGAADEKKGGGYGATGKAGGKDGYPKGKSIIIRAFKGGFWVQSGLHSICFCQRTVLWSRGTGIFCVTSTLPLVVL